VRCSPLASAATGWVIVGPPQNRYFTHGGVDAGFESMMVAYESGDGAIVITNGVGGTRLATEVRPPVSQSLDLLT
jgi:hypothetical protein